MVSGEGAHKPTPAERRTELWLGRRARLLDLVHGDAPDITNGQRESGFFIAANQLHELMIETSIGALLIPPGHPITRSKVRGLFEPGQLGRPIAKRLPQRALARATISTPEAGDIVNDWTREYGVVFKYDYPSDYRTVTGEVEIGMFMSGGVNGIKAYRRTAVLIDECEFMCEDPTIYEANAAEIDEFLGNMEALVKISCPMADTAGVAGPGPDNRPPEFGDGQSV